MPRKHATKKRSAKKKAAPRADSTQRLQRLLASAGFGSRRQCEDLIEAGRVDVDGAVVTKLGTTVDSDAQKVRVDGVLLKQQKLVYFAVNKPIGVVTTNRDPQGRPRVVDLVPPNERVFPVGRLDRSSEGLILLTNDGELAQRLTHPKFGVRKVYRVTVAGKVDSQTMKRMREGIYIAEGLVRVDGAKLLKTRSRSTEMEIVLREGKNREIRRILANLGHKVQRLRRIAVGPLKLGEVPPGAYRTLSREEIKKLWAAADESTESVPKRRAVKKRAAKGRTGPQRPSKTAKKPATRQPASRSKQPTGAIAAAGSRATGSVIGGDDTASSETTSRPTKSTKRPRKSATGKGRGTKRSVAGKQSKQDRPKRGRERVTATGKRGGSKATARRGKKRN